MCCRNPSGGHSLYMAHRRRLITPHSCEHVWMVVITDTPSTANTSAF
nr:MAG TPA: hypothetical protein [Caudoviricetes sp.]